MIDPTERGGLPTIRMILFVAQGEPNSQRAQDTLQRLCVTELEGRYELEVIDVVKDFQRAADRSVMVTPTLIVTDPAPAVTILGDLRDTERLRAALQLSQSEQS